jgi:hypothetical protein
MNTRTQLHESIARLKAELAALRDAPQSHAESRAILAGWCAEQYAKGERGTQYPVAGIACGGDLDGLLRLKQPFDMAPMFARLLGPRALADALWCDLADTPDGPTAAERAKGIAALEAEIFALELEDEALVLASEAAGAPMARRGDADPRAVIGIDAPGVEDDAPATPSEPLMRSTPHETPPPRTRPVRSEFMARK